MALTIKDRLAVLDGGGQRQSGDVKFIAVVPDADFKPDGVVKH